MADGALNFVGRLEVTPLDELRPREKKEKEIVASALALRELLPRRKYDAYKNQFGRIGVVAGSKGFIGAALMTSQGALRAGAGLVEVFVPEEIYELPHRVTRGDKASRYHAAGRARTTLELR